MSLNASFLAVARDASPVPTGLVTGGSGVGCALSGLVTGGSGVGCALCLLNLSPVPEVAVGDPTSSSEESGFLPPPRILELAFLLLGLLQLQQRFFLLTEQTLL